jgi:hypothetical protein
MNEVFLDAKAVAARYNIHEVTVRKWEAMGKLPPAVRITRGVTRWPLSALLAREAEGYRNEGAAA